MPYKRLHKDIITWKAGRVMLGLIIAIRNFFISLVLAWIGISFTAPQPDSDAPPGDDSAEIQSPATLSGFKC